MIKSPLKGNDILIKQTRRRPYMNMITSYYPVLMVEDVTICRDFFVSKFDFEIVYDSDWYVHLSKKGQKEVNLAFVQFNHESVPKEFRKKSQGILLNLEVDDVEGEFKRLKNDSQIELELREEAWGQKHFILSGPGNILIDIIKVIPPAKEFKESYL